MAKQKRISAKNQVGLAILLGVVFAGMGFIGSYSANFLWYWGQAHRSVLWLSVSGLIAFVIFIGLLLFLIRTAKKFL